MTRFRYTARTAAGAPLRGILLAPDPAAALAGIRERALFVTSLVPARSWLPAAVRSGTTIRARDRVAFMRSFATLIRAGVPIARALRIAVDRTAGNGLRPSLQSVLADIERGTALSAALARVPQAFPPLVVAMVAAGENGGILEDVLERIALFLERDRALRAGIVSAIAYPATVLAASLLLIAFVVVRIVPMFAELFASLHADVPPATQVLFAAAAAANRPTSWLAAGVVTALLAAAAAALPASTAGRRAADRLRLALPFAGPLLRKSIAARFARMLGTLVHAGVDIVTAMETVAPVTGSPLYAAAVERATRLLAQGEALTPQLDASRLFDPLFVALIGIGEESGTLDTMLAKAAEYAESDVGTAVATLAGTLEPALIIGLGAVVGFIVSAVFIPLYTLIGSAGT